MNKWIISSSMNARLLIVALSIAIILFGFSKLSELPMGVYPEYSPVYVEVQTEALGLSADEVEQLITSPLEADLLNGIAWIEEIRSKSMTGLSSVICIFEEGTDMMDARQVIAERLTQAHALPNVSKPPIMLQPYSSTSRVMKVGLSPASDQMSLINLSVLARWTIQPYLMGVEGVANVSIWGQRKRQLQVQVDPEVLTQNDLTLHDVVKTTGEALWVSPLSYLQSSTPGTGGFFDTPNQRLGIRHVLPIKNPEDLGNITIHGNIDKLLGDVTTVVENHQPLIGDAIVNGAPGLMLVIEKFPWADTKMVAENVEDAMDALAPGLTGIAFDTEIYQPKNYIQSSAGNLGAGLGLGLLLAIISLMLLFYDWRSALISSTAIILSLLAGMTVLYLQAAIFDIVIIAGLVMALGIIIDDAITIVENVRVRLAEKTDRTTVKVIMEACAEIRSPLLFATVAVILATVPLYFVGGIAGSFLTPLVSSYLLAIIASLVVAITVIPAMCALVFTGPMEGKRTSPIISLIGGSFERGIRLFMSRPSLAYATLFIFAALGFLALPLIKSGNFLPSPKERNLVVSIESEYGTSHPKMAELTSGVMKEIGSIPGIEKLAAHIGRAVLSDEIANVNYSEIWLTMNDEVNYDETMKNIVNISSKHSELKTKVQTYRQHSLDEAIATDNPTYAMRVYGEDNEIVRKKADEVAKAIGSLGGVQEVKVNYPVTEPTIEIKVDLEKAKQYNIKPGDVRRAAAILLSGLEVGSLFEGQKVFDVVVWGTPNTRNSIASVKNLLVDKPNGGKVRLGEVADVKLVKTPTVIDREGVSRYMDVTFDYNGSSSTLAPAIYQSIDHIQFPLEYHAELVGDYAKQARINKQAWSVSIAAIIGIFLLLQVVFWSWRMAILSLLSTTMALAGGLIATFLGGLSLNLGVVVGFFAILSISFHQSIVLISRFRQLELDGTEGLTHDLVLQGISDRFAPILMTTALTLLVLLPFVFIGGAGLEVISPMSIVVIGGSITTALLNLYILPVLYFKFGKVPESIVEEERAMIDLDLNLAA